MNQNQSLSADRQIVLELERKRCDVLVQRDFDVLAQLIADDVVHVHADGRAEDKAGFLEGQRHKLRIVQIERPHPEARVYGESIVVTGPVQQTVEFLPSGQRAEMSAFVTQVWVRSSGRWQQVSYQATLIK